MKKLSLVVLGFLVPWDAHAMCETLGALGRGVASPERSRAQTQYYVNAIKDPSFSGLVSVKDLDSEIRASLSQAELEGLTQAFHELLVRGAATGGPGQSNLEHVSLHYRDIQKNADALAEYFGVSKEVALAVAAAHDLGKVAGDTKDLTPEMQLLFETLKAESDKDNPYTILAHELYSMNAIRTTVEKQAAKLGWDDAKTKQVIRLFQSAIARHNAGYDPKLPGFHWWATNWPRLAKKLQEKGIEVDEEYKAVEGGAVPMLLAAIDRGTSLDFSFVEKIAAESGRIPFEGGAIGGFLAQNAKSVRSEVENILFRMEPHLMAGKRIEEFPLYRQYKDNVERAETAGAQLQAINDWTKPYPGRPEVMESERAGFVYFEGPGKVWTRVSKEGKREVLTPDGWEYRVSQNEGKPVLILMREVVGYERAGVITP